MNVAVSCDHVSKRFKIPLDRSSTLKYRITHLRSASRYQTLEALQDVSFEVPSGQFLGIIGHNGSGKSTLLKILSRIYLPNSGSIQINGAVSPFLELGVGFNPELTARENIYLNGAVLGLTRVELHKRVDHIIAFAELENFVEQKLKNFSSGMQVRLAFAVATQADASILLMDEVLAVGDARFQEKCFDVFARYKQEGRTIILVTHDLGSVNSYCDRALLLDHGRLIADDTPANVTSRYRRMVGAQAEEDNQDTFEGPQPNRWGSREAEIVAVRVQDASGAEHRTFATGAAMTVEVDYRVNRDDVGDFICALGFSRADGVGLAGTNTGIDGFHVPSPPLGSTGTISYAIDGLPFLGAAYVVNVAIVDAHLGREIDHIDNARSFRVVDERGQPGLVALNGKWMVGKPPVRSSVKQRTA